MKFPPPGFFRLSGRGTCAANIPLHHAGRIGAAGVRGGLLGYTSQAWSGWMMRDAATAAGAAIVLGALVYATDAYPQDIVAFGGVGYGRQEPPPDARNVSTVAIGPSTRPGALADVTFDNVPVNNQLDTGQTRRLVGQGLTVSVQFTYNADRFGADRVTLTPPDGVMCWPSCEMTVMEGMAQTVTLYDATAVGM